MITTMFLLYYNVSFVSQWPPLMCCFGDKTNTLMDTSVYITDVRSGNTYLQIPRIKGSDLLSAKRLFHLHAELILNKSN